MAEQEARQETKQETKQETSQETKQEDLVTRASKVEIKQEPKEETFNINDFDNQIEQIQDPKLKEQVLSLKKSLISGGNRKYQEIATLRKEFETKIAEQNKWTPEKVQSLVTDPNFINAAKSVVEKPDDDSMLSEKERQILENNNKQVQLLLNQNAQLHKQQQYDALKVKHANFDPTSMDTITSDILNGKRQVTYEDIWKAMDYDSGLKRAYELGRQDKQKENEERLGGMSYDTSGMARTSTRIEPQKNEPVGEFFVRSYKTHVKTK